VTAGFRSTLYGSAAEAESGLRAALQDHPDPYLSPSWFARFAACCLDEGERARLDMADGPEGRAFFPLRSRTGRFGPLRFAELAGLSNFYSMRWAPPGLEAAEDPAGLAERWARAVRGGRPAPARLWFDALDRPGRAFDGLAEGLRRAGWWIEPFAQFVNWHLPVAGLSFDEYWRGRPGALRTTVARKARQLARTHASAFEIVREPAGAGRAIAAYETVHAASWKPAEPYPAFMPRLIREGLAGGFVRVGLLFADGLPAAAQVWVLGGGKATIYKLSYDEAWKGFSVGSILTRQMMEDAFDRGGLTEIDFGWGDDAYKRDWLPERRDRWGLAAYNPRTLAGLALAGRNLGARRLRGRRD
jgi:ribosomal protein S18 acetylase RimI-like enzyme